MNPYKPFWGWTQSTFSSFAQGFLVLFFTQNFSLATYFPLPTYITSFWAHSIAKVRKGLKTSKLWGLWGLGAKCNRFKQGKMQELEGVMLGKMWEFEGATQGKMWELEGNFFPFIFLGCCFVTKRATTTMLSSFFVEKNIENKATTMCCRLLLYIWKEERWQQQCCCLFFFVEKN